VVVRVFHTLFVCAVSTRYTPPMLRHRNPSTVPLRAKIYCAKMQDDLADSLYTFDLRSSGLFRPVTNILSLTFNSSTA